MQATILSVLRLVQVLAERSDEPAGLVCMADQSVDVALHVSASRKLRCLLTERLARFRRVAGGAWCTDPAEDQRQHLVVFGQEDSEGISAAVACVSAGRRT